MVAIVFQGGLWTVVNMYVISQNEHGTLLLHEGGTAKVDHTSDKDTTYLYSSAHDCNKSFKNNIVEDWTKLDLLQDRCSSGTGGDG